MGCMDPQSNHGFFPRMIDTVGTVSMVGTVGRVSRGSRGVYGIIVALVRRNKVQVSGREGSRYRYMRSCTHMHAFENPGNPLRIIDFPLPRPIQFVRYASESLPIVLLQRS